MTPADYDRLIGRISIALIVALPVLAYLDIL